MTEHKKLVHALRTEAQNLRDVVNKLTPTLGKSAPALRKLHKIDVELCCLRAGLDVKMQRELGDAYDGEHYRSRGA
jgi:hypothetical protein